MEAVKVKVLVAERLYRLPKKMNSFRSSDVLAECVLWELSHELCLHFHYAAYFLYNPDFHLCKGVAGIKHGELSEWHGNEPWHNMNDFERTIKNTNFNKIVRSLYIGTDRNDAPDNVSKKLQSAANLESSCEVIWHTKNDNMGILLYEAHREADIDKDEVENAVEYLSFCTL